VLCFTGHKGLMGPQGNGRYLCHAGTELRPWNVGGTGVRSYMDEQPMEYPERWKPNAEWSRIAGLLAAVSYKERVNNGENPSHEMNLMKRFNNAIKDRTVVRVYGGLYRGPGTYSRLEYTGLRFLAGCG
jgi:selenocysteine lyase/cysteine desulfurase